MLLAKVQSIGMPGDSRLPLPSHHASMAGCIAAHLLSVCTLPHKARFSPLLLRMATLHRCGTCSTAGAWSSCCPTCPCC